MIVQRSLVLGVAVLLAGCTAAGSPSASPTPSVPPLPSATATAAPTPTPSATPTAEPTATPSPSPTATPAPTPSAPPAIGSRWTATRPMPIPLEEPIVVPLPDGRIVVLGPDPRGFRPTAEGKEQATSVQVRSTSGSWRVGASLPRTRVQPAVTTLADGRILLVGGLRPWMGPDDPGASYGSTWLYDPQTDAWTKAGNLANGRADAAIARLPDGRVLVAGGFFYKREPFGTGGGGVELATLDGSGAGGRGAPADVDPEPIGRAIATAELYDPRTDTWTMTGAMRYARSGARAVALADGRVLVVGSHGRAEGISLPDGAMDSAEIWDPRTGRFTLTGSLPAWDAAAISERIGMTFEIDWGERTSTGTLVALAGGDALLVGQWDSWKHYADGTRSFRYEARTGRWRETGRTWLRVDDWEAGRVHTLAGVPIADPGVVTLPSGRVLILGGRLTPNYLLPVTVSEALLAYDPGDGSWHQLGHLPADRTAGGIALDREGALLVIGGTIRAGSGDELHWDPTGAVLRSGGAR